MVLLIVFVLVFFIFVCKLYLCFFIELVDFDFLYMIFEVWLNFLLLCIDLFLVCFELRDSEVKGFCILDIFMLFD